MASNFGGVDFSSIRHPAVAQAPSWRQDSLRKQAELTREGIHPGAGLRMAREQPALHYLYGQIDDMTDAARKEKREKLQVKVPPPTVDVVATLSVRTLFITGEEDVVAFPGLSVALASVMPIAKVESVPRTGHSVYFERAEAFNLAVDRFNRTL
jgi:3-oxoadipate enol-lactonase